jgi:agmatine deiminase
VPALLNGTTRADGFRMPAEWEPHSCCYLVWPQRPDNWRNGGKPAQAVWVRLATVIVEAEPVTVLARADRWRNARARLPRQARVVEATTDDAWVRDTGPSFVVDDHGGRRAVDWAFNAWGGLRGGLYFPRDSDDLLGQKIAELEGADCYQPRRPVIWLPRGVYLDEADGHVDNIARFVAPGVVVLTWTDDPDDPDDPQYERSMAALKILQSVTDARGRSLEVIPVHQPGPLTITEQEAAGVDAVPGSQPRRAGDRLAGSYVNCLLANGIVVVPVFGDPQDEAALETYRRLLPVTEPARD